MTSRSDLPSYMKVGDLANMLGVSRSTIYKWVEEGHFPKPFVFGSHKPDGKVSVSRWNVEEVENWIAERPREITDE